ncbi:hypothetical protein L249_3709 [Ophiocordyceps polyrhachis-furcata BCC 54312]|uniref:Secreted protein n=1 Tax=Ophiocordyceps polyrhachis-furcata BCC 54312 TaxID=1330021 RepID=A0A367L4N4_9HYPO|nr:hypothetical protein L249_3709 [Ophiocordyceps polyrhachis-furcata BCC 54312]
MKMLFGIQTVLLSLFATASLAFRLETVQRCTQLAIVSDCGVEGRVYTDQTEIEVSVGDGCSKPKGNRSINRICVDWENKRAHVTLRHDLRKRCLKQLPVVRCASDGPGPSWCFKNTWQEVPCT